MSQTAIYIPAGSPLWDYSASSWTTGVAQAKCHDASGCRVKLATLQSLSWQRGGSGSIAATMDGQTAQLDVSTNGANLPLQQGPHILELQIGQGITFAGGTIQTTVGSNGNYTLDDAAPSITYQGFTASANSPPPIKKDKNAAAFYKGTISYTSSSSATASFTFANSLLQIYGSIGPAFGTFSVRVDQADCGSYSANRQEDSDGKAVLLWTGQFQPGQHQVQITNMQDGQSLALDYMVADGQANADWIGATGPAAPGPMQPDAGVFGAPKSEGKSSVGAIIGGILAALFILLALLFWWRLRQYRKAGGEGSALVACFGSARKPAPPAAGPGKGDFKIWPMTRSRPKYATYA